MTVKLFYGDKFDMPVRTGKSEDAESIQIALGEKNSLESRYISNRLFVLAELAAILITSGDLKEIYIPVRLDENRNEFLSEQWAEFKMGRNVATVELVEGDTYEPLSTALRQYKRVGLFIQKTSEGSVAELVEIETNDKLNGTQSKNSFTDDEGNSAVV